MHVSSGFAGCLFVQTSVPVDCDVDCDFYMPCRFPNGCAQVGGKWDLRRVTRASASEWIMWHAACIQGMAKKLQALQGVASLLQGH